MSRCCIVSSVFAVVVIGFLVNYIAYKASMSFWLKRRKEKLAEISKISENLKELTERGLSERLFEAKIKFLKSYEYNVVSILSSYLGIALSIALAIFGFMYANFFATVDLISDSWNRKVQEVQEVQNVREIIRLSEEIDQEKRKGYEDQLNNSIRVSLWIGGVIWAFSCVIDGVKQADKSMSAQEESELNNAICKIEFEQAKRETGKRKIFRRRF